MFSFLWGYGWNCDCLWVVTFAIIFAEIFRIEKAANHQLKWCTMVSIEVKPCALRRSPTMSICKWVNLLSGLWNLPMSNFVCFLILFLFFFNTECFVASKFLFYWTYSVYFWYHAQWLLEGQISRNFSMFWNSTFTILYLRRVEWVSWLVSWIWCLAVGNIAFLAFNGVIIPENLWRISLKIVSSDSAELTSVYRYKE